MKYFQHSVELSKDDLYSLINYQKKDPSLFSSQLVIKQDPSSTRKYF